MERTTGYSILEVLWAVVSAAAARAADVLRAYARARGRAAAARELHHLSDHLLRDIGLHRSQIEAVVHGEHRWS